MKRIADHRLFPLLGLLWVSATVFGQGNAPTRNCPIITEEAVSIWLKNDSLLRAYQGPGTLFSRSEHTIPVVFHLVLPVGSDSITLDDIYAQLEVLNDCFNGQQADLSDAPDEFRGVISRDGPRFCLGAREENGILVPGVELRFTDEPDFAQRTNPEGKTLIKYSQFGGFDAWDPLHYLNVWVGELSFAQGSATFPGSGLAVESGVIIDPDYFGIRENGSGYDPFGGGKTLVHEIGHFFNLLHVWGLEESCDSDDGISDTPLQDRIYLGCPSGKQFSCGSSDMYMNFMNFTDDDCLLFFTKEQMNRMIQSIHLFYPGLDDPDHCYGQRLPDNPLESVSISYSAENRRLRFESPFPVQNRIAITLYQLDGKQVAQAQLYHERLEEIRWNDIPAGIYILFLQSEDNFVSHKLFLY